MKRNRVSFAGRDLGKAFALLSCLVVLLSSCTTAGQRPPNQMYAGQGNYRGQSQANLYEQQGYLGATSATKQQSGSVMNLREVDYWRQQASMNPYNPNAAINFINALRKARRFDEGKAVAETAQQRHPENRDVSLAYLRLLGASGAYTDALTLVDRFGHDPNGDLRLKAFRASMLDAVGRHKEAQRDYATVLQLWPTHLPTLNNYALSLALGGDFNRGIGILQQASTTQGADQKVSKNLSLLLALNGQVEAAISVASKYQDKAASRKQMLTLAAQVENESPQKALRRILGLQTISLSEQNSHNVLSTSPTAAVRKPNAAPLDVNGGWTYPTSGSHLNQIGGKAQ